MLCALTGMRTDRVHDQQDMTSPVMTKIGEAFLYSKAAFMAGDDKPLLPMSKVVKGVNRDRSDACTVGAAMPDSGGRDDPGFRNAVCMRLTLHGSLTAVRMTHLLRKASLFARQASRAALFT